jgi:nitrous-oxide reductase
MKYFQSGEKRPLGLWLSLAALATILIIALVVACSSGTKTSSISGPADLMALAAARGLSPEDAAHAVKSFVPPGKHDDFFLFASGGHSGQVHVVGVPSMRLLKTIAVFTPESWQGYGYGADWSEKVLNEGGKDLRWGDSHHPALSETDGKYDGRFLFINDRANGRIAMVDLSDFRTKQIMKVPNIQTSHGGIFATPDTKYVHISSMVPASKEWNGGVGAKVSVQDHLNHYGDIYRGYSTFLHVNQKTGHMELDQSFQIELPPYSQDLADAGKGASYGYAFINSINTELATGGTNYGKPALESGASKGDFDYLHIINWLQAEKTVAAGRFKIVNGVRVIPLETAIADGILFFAPEPRSPHGVDVAPKGDYIAVAGKLDPHVTIYGMDKIKAAIAKKDFEGKDRYGVPILRFDSVMAGQVEVGAGPLHTQFDEKGNAYTSLFLESAVAKWTLGPPYHTQADAWKVVEKLPVNYNIGHLAVAEGDTAAPQGKYLVAMNKWALDRHANVGPLHPQNFQLVDLTGAKMDLVADMPIGFGEPHYAQLVRASVIKAKDIYPLGFSPAMDAHSPDAISKPTDARVVHRPGVTEVWMSVIRSQFRPDIVQAHRGDKVIIHLSSLEQASDATHGFAIPEKNINVSLDAGETTTISFTADKPGSFSFYCTEFCSALHLEMQGWLIVEG